MSDWLLGSEVKMKRASGGLLDAEFDSSDEEDEDYVPEEGDGDDDDEGEEGVKEDEGQTEVEDAKLSSSAADIWAKLKAKTSTNPANGDAKPAEEKKPEEKKEPEKRTITEVYDFAGEKVEFVVEFLSFIHYFCHIFICTYNVKQSY